MKNLNIILIIILLIIIIIYIIIYILLPQKQNFYSAFAGQDRRHLSKEETFNFLASDSDNYIHNFNKSDLISRKVFIQNSVQNSIQNYLYQISNAAESFTDNEKIYLNKISQKANNNILNLNSPISSKLANIKFIFAKTKNRLYENGFPHTRENIIFLATPFFNFPQQQAISTLIHEKIHLFQRLYPTDTHQYLENNGYKYLYEMTQDQTQLKRSNPDINNSIWSDPNGNIMLPFFKNNNPKSMSDMITSEKNQHPYEAMAYMFENAGIGFPTE